MIQKHLAIDFNMNNKQERQIIDSIHELLEFYHTPEQKELQKSTRDPNVLYNFEKEEQFYTDKATQEELEEDLVDAVRVMKSFANSFSTHFKEDEKQIKRLTDLQSKNKSNMDVNMGSIVDFETLAKNLGFMKLIYMGLTAIALTIVTFIFIYIDALIF